MLLRLLLVVSQHDFGHFFLCICVLFLMFLFKQKQIMIRSCNLTLGLSSMVENLWISTSIWVSPRNVRQGPCLAYPAMGFGPQGQGVLF